MVEQNEKKKEPPPGPNGEVCRDLICAEEWKDPEGRKVLTEYHKEGLPKELAGVDADMEGFERYWKKKGGSVKVKGEYHKDGAPFLDHGPGSDAVKTSDGSGSAAGEANPQGPGVIPEASEGQAAKPGTPPQSPGSQPLAGKAPPGNIQRPINLGMIEMASYALFRVAFSKGVSIPIKRDGMVDMDVTVKGKEITINTNQLYFSVPELNVWHVVYQHKGKPIVELGRGVKNGVKIRRLQAARLALEMWNGSRKINKQRLMALKEADKNVHERPGK